MSRVIFHPRQTQLFFGRLIGVTYPPCGRLSKIGLYSLVFLSVHYLGIPAVRFSEYGVQALVT